MVVVCASIVGLNVKRYNKMEKQESYIFSKEEVYKIFEKKLGKKVKRIRHSPREGHFKIEV